MTNSKTKKAYFLLFFMVLAGFLNSCFSQIDPREIRKETWPEILNIHNLNSNIRWATYKTGASLSTDQAFTENIVINTV